MAYTYLAADLLTGAILGELPLSSVSFTSQLNGAGGFSGRLMLGDPRVTALDPLGSTQPARTALYVDRDGVLVWGGIIWTRRYDGVSRMLELGGSEMWSYFRRRRETSTVVRTQVDQLTIAQQFITRAQAKPGGNIGVVVGTETSGVLRDRTYYSYELKPVAEAVEQLSALENGFDFAIDVSYVAGVATKTLNLSYPRRGRPQGSTGHMFEFPGNVVAYSWPEDGTAMSDTVYGVGAGEGDKMLRSVAARTDLIDGGYPLLEETHTYKDVSVQATLDSHARSDLAASANPVTIPSLTVRADLDPVLGSYICGDDARIRISDPRFAALDTFKRIVAITVRPGTDSPDQVQLTLGDAG